MTEGRRIVVVGLGIGGLYAIKYAMSTDPKAQVTVVEKRTYDMYSPCGLPFVLEGVVKDFEALKHSVPGTLRRLEKLAGHEALSVDSAAKTVRIRNLATGEEFARSYDSLVLSCGSNPVVFEPVRKFLGRGLYLASNLETTQALEQAVRESKTKRAVIIGAGPIGLEVAYALKVRGFEVHIVERLACPLPRALDPDMGKLVEEYLTAEGFKTIWGRGFDSIDGEGSVRSVKVGDAVIETDVVVLAVGNTGRTELAKSAGCECTPRGIVTNAKMATSVADIYAVGDCVETFDLFTKKPTTMFLATSAYKQGQVAGVNAAGGSAAYDGAMNTFATQVGHFEMASTGMTTESAKAAGFDAVSMKAKFYHLPEYFPGHREVTVKLIAQKGTGRVLGGQCCGAAGAGAAWRVNMIALAAKHGLTVKDLSNAELAYTPPISDVYDVLSMTADFTLRRL